MLSQACAISMHRVVAIPDKESGRALNVFSGCFLQCWVTESASAFEDSYYRSFSAASAETFWKHYERLGAHARHSYEVASSLTDLHFELTTSPYIHCWRCNLEYKIADVAMSMDFQVLLVFCPRFLCEAHSIVGKRFEQNDPSRVAELHYQVAAREIWCDVPHLLLKKASILCRS